MKKNHKKSIPKSAKMRQFLSPRVKKKKVTKHTGDSVPRITNDSVSKHREEVISGAKKYVYPLQHSRRKIVMISVNLLIVVVIVLVSYIMLSLYKFQSTTNYIYQVTRAVPFPVGKIGSTFVPYEEYLFEIKHYMHYFETQQGLDFDSEQGKAQLEAQKKRTLEKVMNNAYVRQIAKENDITVTSKEVDDRIELLKNQHRLGNDDETFDDILKDFYGWTLNDFRRTIAQELLNDKVAKHMDPEVRTKAQVAMDELTAGVAFPAVARKYSEDDTTKENGGELGFLIAKNDRNIPEQTINALNGLQPGEISGIIDLGHGLEIVRLDAIESDKFKASRIYFAYKPLAEYLNDLKESDPAKVYITIKVPEPVEASAEN